MNEWIGFGPSACSQYQNKRWKNPANLDKWEIGVREGFSSKDYDEFSNLSEQTLAEDSILFGLRMNQGIKIHKIGERFGLSRKSLKNLSDFFISFLINLSDFLSLKLFTASPFCNLIVIVALSVAIPSEIV